MGWRDTLKWWVLDGEDPIDRYQSTNQFVAVALTDGYALTQLQVESLIPVGSDNFKVSPSTPSNVPQRIERIAFRGRLLDGGAPSPHSYLSDPCRLDKTTSPAYAMALILEHTEFILTEDYFNSTSKQTINRNDRVNVYLNPGPNDTPFDLERGWCVGVHKSGIINSKRGDTVDCTSLEEIMEKANLSTRAAGAEHRPEASPDLSVDPNAEECIDLDSQAIAYPCRKDMDVTLVVFYHGTGFTENEAGETVQKGAEEAQQDVLRAVKKTGIPDNVMFLIPRGHGAGLGDVEAAIAELMELGNEITMDEKKMRLGGWSAGASGFSKAYTRSTPWDKLMLADPSPEFTWNSEVEGAYMEYNPDNWTNFDGNHPELEELGVLLETALAPAIIGAGGTAVNYGASHQKILEEILKKIAQ